MCRKVAMGAGDERASGNSLSLPLQECKRLQGSDGGTAFRDDSRHSAYRRLQSLPNRLNRQRQLLQNELCIKAQHPKPKPLQHQGAPSIGGNALTMVAAVNFHY